MFNFLNNTFFAQLFGKPVLSVDVNNEGGCTWILSYHWRGHIYLEKTGVAAAGESILIPSRTHIVRN